MTEEKQRSYYSHGKLLISGEYLVVDGAEGLALPCRKGQIHMAETMGSPILVWTAYDEVGEVWFEAMFSPDSSGRPLVIDATDKTAATGLTLLLRRCTEINPDFEWKNHHVKTFLEFNRAWGLGSSSTMISNLAQWAGVDPFTLFYSTQNGSGYDIACATEDVPILFSREGNIPQVERVSFLPSFRNQLFFVHLGKKQKSDREVTKYHSLQFDKPSAIRKINGLTHSLLRAESIEEFSFHITEHESFMSEVLQRPTIQEERFSDYPGFIKSLGAWGGDFVLVQKQEDFENYFSTKGLTQILSFDEMVL